MSEAASRPLAPLATATGLGAMAGAAALLPAGLRPVPIVLAALAALSWWTIVKPVRWIALFFICALLLPPLPIALGDSGPHPAMLVVVLGLAAGALRLADWRFRIEPLPASLASYFLVLLASVAMAALYSGASIAAATFARVMLFGISLYVFLYTAYGPGRVFDARRGVSLVYWLGLGSAVFACVDFYWQLPAPAGFGPQFVWLPTGVFRRAQGFFYEASTLGNLCAFFLTMIVAALLSPKEARPVPRAALAAGAAVFGTALMFSYSRASLVNLSVAVLLLLFRRRRTLKLRRIAAVAGGAVGAAVLAGFLMPQFAEMYWGRLQGTARFFFPDTEAVLSGRFDTWRAAERFLLDRPERTLLGVGYKTLPYSSVAGRPLVVDNMYLSALAETGVAGLAALLLLCAAILGAAHRAAGSPDPYRSFLGAWVFSFWIGEMLQMLSGDLLTYWRVLPVYFFVLALAVRERTA